MSTKTALVKEELRISQHLEDLIIAANSTTETLVGQVKEIYETAIIEGFTPFQARELIVQRVLSISPSYLRKILPEEAKHVNMIREPIPKEDPKIALQVAQIESAQAETILVEPEVQEDKAFKEQVIHESKQEQQEIALLKRVSDLENQLKVANKDLIKANQQIEKLQIKSVKTFGKKFNFNTELELPNHEFLPLIVTVFPDKEEGYVRIDKKRLAK